ncbi:MAG: carbohydrate-binding domain-containing protein [Clostridia bacterium]|nr:carbohydrate-binding domain-containing protein [Clostridia bacterium]
MKRSLKKLGALVIALMLTLGAFPFAAFAEEAYPTIALDTETTVSVEAGDGDGMTFKFVPDEYGLYEFYSYNSTSDPAALIMDEEGTDVAYDDDGGEDNNFRIAAYLEANKTYLLNAYFLSAEAPETMNVRIIRGIEPTEISIDQGESYTDRIGGELYLGYTFKPENASPISVSWTTDNEDVVSVSDYGYAQFFKEGTATVKATLPNGISDSIEFNVVGADPIALDTEYAVSHEEYKTAAFSFTPEESGYYVFFSYGATDMIWAHAYDSNMNSFLSIYPDENDFRMEAYLIEGETYYFTARHDSEDCTSGYNVKLSAMVNATSVSLNYTEFTGTIGSMIKLSTEFAPYNSISEYVFWSSSDENVVTVDSDGTVSLNAIGVATVIAESESGLKAECVVTVTEIPYITVCSRFDGIIAAEDTTLKLRFIPEIDGTYIFYSDADKDTCGRIYDAATMEELEYNDDGGSNSQFIVKLEMSAGKEYLLEASFFDHTETGPLPVIVSRVDEYDEIIHNLDEDGRCDCGYELHDHISSDYDISFDWHSGYCDICGKWFEEDHNFSEGDTCVCGYQLHDHEISEYYYDTDYHYGTCDICEFYVEETHEYNEEGYCDCGYFIHDHKFTKYTFNDEIHESICEICDLSVYEDHIYDEDGKCLCGYFIHEHKEDKLEYDYLEHWISCSLCGINPDNPYEAHNYVDGRCEVCGKEKITGVLFADIHLKDGEYLDNYGNVTTTEPAGGYAHISGSTLTFSDFSFNKHSDYFDKTVTVYTESSYTLVLKGTNIISAPADAIYLCIGDLTIEGDGSLKVTSEGDFDAIDLNGGSLTINGGRLDISAVDNGIEVIDNLTVNGGIINIIAGDDGIDVKGSVLINDGIINIEAEDIGIDSRYNVTINDGCLYITTNDYEGIDTYGDIIINGGNFVITAKTSTCMYSDETVYIHGGNFVLVSNNCDSVITAYGDIEIDYDYGISFEFPRDEWDCATLSKVDDASVIHNIVLKMKAVAMVSVDDKPFFVTAGEKTPLEGNSFLRDGILGYALKGYTVENGEGDIVYDEETNSYCIIANGDVTLSSEYYIVADTNGDGKVNARDKAAITQIIKGVADGSDAADVNLDGKVNARDKAAVTQIIGGKYDYAPYYAN